MALFAGKDLKEQAEWAMNWHLLFLTEKIFEETSILPIVSMSAEIEEHKIAPVHVIIQQIFAKHLHV